ncbi:MAG: dehydrogenase [Pseudomonadota bacterium]|nr:dehydrogenase [Pseudomonadota bacterium]
MIVRARAPLRLGLAGGGTDVSPYCDLHGGAVMNATIAKYAYATIELLATDKVVFEAADRDERIELPSSINFKLGGGLTLHKGVYSRIMRDYCDSKPLPLRLSTLADAAAGSGLGSSSAMIVSMIQAFVETLSLPLGKYEVARLAYDIERKDLGLNGGKQDQYAATFGGFNFMEFHADDRVIVNPLQVKDAAVHELEASLVLYFTGISRHSASIIDEQSDNVRAGKQQSIEAMHELKRESASMKEHLLLGDMAALGRALRAGWEAKKRMANSISNEHIDRIEQVTRQAGAIAGKVSGAGGGGFMFFLTPPDARKRVIDALGPLGGIVTDCHFTHKGATAWRVR